MCIRDSLDILAVLVEGGGADAVQLAPGQQGLEPVSYTHLDVYKRQALSW